MQMSCFWPVLKSAPESEISVSSFAGKEVIFARSCTFSMASQSCSSDASPKGSRFRRMVPLKRIGSCGMMERDFRSRERLMSAVSMPSMRMAPSGCVRRKRVVMREDFLKRGKLKVILALIKKTYPAPVRPTIPTFSPPFTLKESS